MENFRLSIEESEGMSFGCLVDQRDRLVASSFGSSSPLVERHLVEYSTKTILKSFTRTNHWLAQEMIRRFEGAKNPKNVNLNRAFVSTHQAKVTTYGLISDHIGSAPRAVGGAVGSNPWSIFVPCHRVVPVSLTIGNYSLCGTLGESGSVTKRKLLVREGVPIDKDRIDSAVLWNPSEGA